MNKIDVTVLGGTGMLGAMVVDYLAKDSRFNVTATARSLAESAGFQKVYPHVTWKEFSVSSHPEALQAQLDQALADLVAANGTIADLQAKIANAIAALA